MQAGESGAPPRWSRGRRWLGLLCLLAAVVYLAIELLPVRSVPRAIFALVVAASVAANAVYLAFPERIPTRWDRPIEGRPWLLATLVLLAILVPTGLFVLVVVTEYSR